MFNLDFTDNAKQELEALRANPAMKKQANAVTKALRFLANNPKHPSLNTHKLNNLFGPDGKELFEAYAENKTPGAYRILFYYPKTKGLICITSITPHL